MNHATRFKARIQDEADKAEILRRGIGASDVAVVLGSWRRLSLRLTPEIRQVGPWLDFLISNPDLRPRSLADALRSARHPIPRERPPIDVKPLQLAKEARETGKHLPARRAAPATVNARRGTTNESEDSTHACQPPS